MKIGEKVVVSVILLPVIVVAQNTSDKVDVKEFLESIHRTLRKIIEYKAKIEKRRQTHTSRAELKTKVRKQILQKLSNPYRILSPQHYIIKIKENNASEQQAKKEKDKDLQTTPLQRTDLNIVVMKIRLPTIKQTQNNLKKLFSRVMEKMGKKKEKNMADREHDKSGSDVSVSDADSFYLSEIEDFLLWIIRKIVSSWKLIKVLFLDNDKFFKKWEKGMCECIYKEIFTDYYKGLFGKPIDIKVGVSSPLIFYRDKIDNCKHSICLLLLDLNNLTNDKKLLKYLNNVQSCVISGNLNSQKCRNISYNVGRLYYTAWNILKKMDEIISKIFVTYLEILSTSLEDIEISANNLIKLLVNVQFAVDKERLNNIISTFVVLQNILKEETRYEFQILKESNCSDEISKNLQHIFDKFMMDYSSFINKIDKRLYYTTGFFTLDKKRIEWSKNQNDVVVPMIMGFLMSVFNKAPEELYSLMTLKEYQKILEWEINRELEEKIIKGIFQEKKVCWMIVAGILLHWIGKEPLIFLYKRLRYFKLEYVPLILGGEQFIKYYTPYYKSGLANKIIDEIKSIKSETELMNYLSLFLPHGDASYRKWENHAILLAHLDYIVYSVYSILRINKCMNRDKEKEFEDFVEKYRCLLEGKEIGCLGGGWMIWQSLLKNATLSEANIIYLHNYSNFSMKLRDIPIKDVEFIKTRCPQKGSNCRFLDGKGWENIKKNFCTIIGDRDTFNAVIEFCVDPVKKCSEECGSVSPPSICYMNVEGDYSMETYKCCNKCPEGGRPTSTCNCGASQECNKCVTAVNALRKVFIQFAIERKNEIDKFCSLIKEEMKPACCSPYVCDGKSNLFLAVINTLEQIERVIKNNDMFAELKRKQKMDSEDFSCPSFLQ